MILKKNLNVKKTLNIDGFFFLKYPKIKMKEKKKEKESPKKVPSLSPETKKSIIGVLLFASAFFLFLSFFNRGGIVGEKINFISSYLFGTGKFAFPLTLFALSFIFLLSSRVEKIYLTSFLGGGIAFLSFLALLSLLFKKGGKIGEILAFLERGIGKYPALIFWLALIWVGVFLMFDISFKEIKKVFKRKKKEKFEPFIEIEKLKEKEEKEIKKPKQIFEEKIKEEKKKEPEIEIKKIEAPQRKKILPPIEILEEEKEKPKVADLQINMNIIKRTLENFGIQVEMGEVNVGPSITRYTLRPAQGTKLSKIVALQNELALALAAHPIRIEAPIPGKSLIGIEVPNKTVTLVRLKNLINTQTFKESGPLTFPLGRDVSGEPCYVDLSEMPHLLIAGATGSGKSICIHSLISSFLFKNTPEILKLILIDPKKVELSLYEGLPHLITPVITEAKKAIVALKWACQEMDRRYSFLLENNARDIFAYNKAALKKKKEPLPFLVIIIDELADLMSLYPKEIEASIVRLAQLARATGIHLVVSTQRPSTDVITGLIKANITCRIAMKVASQVDSRTIIDIAGAEKLLGNGDMLFLSPQFSKPKRIQGVYISVTEIKRLVDFWKKAKIDEKEIKEKPEFEESQEDSSSSTFLDLDEFQEEIEEDPLYPEAYRLVVETQKASATYLQRCLKIGYARAARLLDMLEKRGVVGPSRGAKPREVYHKKVQEEEK